MQSSFITYRSSSIHYVHTTGSGQPVFCFHGYGEEGAGFSFLEVLQDQGYALYAIDLPFHGQTEWKEGLNCEATDLLAIMQLILQRSSSSSEKIILLGFSLGGRMALAVLQEAPQLIDRMILLAPDGLKVNAWYWLATQTWLGNRFFAFTMKHPYWFFALLRLLNKLRLVNTSIFKFVNYYIGDKEVRRLLYARWTTLRKLKPTIKQIKKYIKDNNIPTRLLYGRHDRIILPVVGERFQKGIEEQCTLKVIASGHQVLHEKHSGEILAAFGPA